ncbi:hypothetical protein ACFFJY_02770 [Fictibacillus aquaticus]|uniref:Transcriptional regulator n=1 Tax=Fictibacillus aquaticus TaxID=2021314 RepID=A0A235F959_9BACL|nr:hypothetical protein [Fictibacillus aquaticus]OYD57624.1 hypothetical protein CGZ90_13235 [Fictibacillus aquaticus]
MIHTNEGRTKLSLWLDKQGLDVEWLMTRTKLSKEIILKSVKDSDYRPSGSAMRVILSVLKEKQSTVKLSDFWDV